MKQKEAEGIEKAVAQAAEDRAKAIQDMRKFTEERLKLLKQQGDLAKELVYEHLHTWNLSHLRELKLRAECTSIEQQITTTSDELTEITRQLEQKSTEVAEAKDRAKKALDRLNAAKAELDETTQNRLTAEAMVADMETLETDEVRLQAQIEAGSNVDRGVLDEYEERKASVGFCVPSSVGLAADPRLSLAGNQAGSGHGTKSVSPG